MKSAVAVKNLSHSFGSQPVLRNLSFRVQQGVVFIIIGPNGSGKTTLIKLIVGVLKIQSGRVDILQHPLRNYSQKSLARAIAYVPQGLPLGFRAQRTSRKRISISRALPARRGSIG